MADTKREAPQDHSSDRAIGSVRPETLLVSTEKLDKVATTILGGLVSDGADSKQAFLEMALRALAGDDFTDKAKAEFNWQDGGYS